MNLGQASPPFSPRKADEVRLSKADGNGDEVSSVGVGSLLGVGSSVVEADVLVGSSSAFAEVLEGFLVAELDSGSLSLGGESSSSSLLSPSSPSSPDTSLEPRFPPPYRRRRNSVSVLPESSQDGACVRAGIAMSTIRAGAS
jgi:hypothetical protein